jgi:mannose-6-phosphate isomerase-like protein (cupin superfamily)
MKGFSGDIEDVIKKNTNFRKVLFTGKKLQLVVMSLKAGEDIEEEVHTDRDQFFCIEKGKGEINRKKSRLKKTMVPDLT